MNERLRLPVRESLSFQVLYDVIVANDRAQDQSDFVTFDVLASACAAVAEEHGLSPDDMVALIESIRAEHAQTN